MNPRLTTGLKRIHWHTQIEASFNTNKGSVMDLGIRGKVALVTACSSGLGAAIADRLAQEGAHLVLFARNADSLAALADDLRHRHGADVTVCVGDMTCAQDVQGLAAQIVQRHGGLDLLVLNSGRPPLKMQTVMQETDPERWAQAHAVQFQGPLRVVQAMVPLMAGRSQCRIVGVTSASVKQPMPMHALSTVYRASVAALLKHLANELAPQGITVNMLLPGSIGTQALTASYNSDERKHQVPLRRLGTPEEFAAVVAFFCSSPAGFITGASLQVDGGMVAALQ